MRLASTIVVLSALLLIAGSAYARKVKVYRGLPRNEAELMHRVLNTLQYKDTIGYFYLFPPFDSLWHMVLHNTDNSEDGRAALQKLMEHPQALIEFDPQYNHEIISRFCYVLQKGMDSGIHWDAVMLLRYELQKQPMTRDLIGYDRISPERFMGYMFIRDVAGKVTYCVTIKEIQKINGFFAGGQVYNILEANTIDKFLEKERYERNYIPKLVDSAAEAAKKVALADSLHRDSLQRGWLEVLSDSAKKARDSIIARKNRYNASIPDDDTARGKKMIVDRKYYEGLFDDEIPVELFVRYMKTSTNGRVSFWDGLYKFGDQEKYVKLEITKNSEGKWVMDDDPPLGSMELVLKDKTYTGTWTNNETQAGYDAELTEKGCSPKKMDMLDEILEKGLSDRTDQLTKQDKEDMEAAKKKNKKGKNRSRHKEDVEKNKEDEDE
jgi:hypothetical protein